MSSLTLAGSPVILWVIVAVTDFDIINVPRFIKRFLNDLETYLVITGLISRLLLVGLMLASLRSLPSSAYQIIPWTSYIPHL